MILSLRRITKHYDRPGGRKLALDGVSLGLDRGHMAGIIGPAGSGKSTLLRIACGLEATDGGSVEYRGREIARTSARERARYLRREVGCVWPSRRWSEGLRVLDHVALPLLVDGCDRRTAELRARSSLLACEVEDCAALELAQLSDGEQQLVEIARALVIEPKLMLVDGAVSGLSLSERERVLRLLSLVAREGNAAVLVTGGEALHMAHVDSLLYLCDGRLLHQEPESELGRVYRFPSDGMRQAAGDA